MNIVLLSGGSGTRLWPLSNSVRSKQFLKLFKYNNEYESMVQRVYRQIITVDSSVNITVATSKSQVSMIKNQLGNKVSVCVEPCRRDTFPAIALACSYLYYEKKIPATEVIIVCPVDPYVDNSYYESIKKLSEIMTNSDTDLFLMGIEPTYPSDKYGYIVPEDANNISKVKEFKEKPSVEKAKIYIKNNALWNAGVFAFKLGHLLDKTHSLIDFKDYKDLLGKYDSLQKISFDYAIVEKEKSIKVLRYKGNWKDVGSWNMISEVMEEETKGNVVLDEKCKNTNAINELNIPLLCMGCENMVVVASDDGILVSNKDESDSIKPYVEKIESEVMFSEKSWGTYTVIDKQPFSMTVRLAVNANKTLSYHMHNNREEVWTVVSGQGKTIVDGIEQIVNTGDVIAIAPKCKHTIQAITPMEIIEVQIGSCDVKDKVKYSLNDI